MVNKILTKIQEGKIPNKFSTDVYLRTLENLMHTLTSVPESIYKTQISDILNFTIGMIKTNINSGKHDKVISVVAIGLKLHQFSADFNAKILQFMDKGGLVSTHKTNRYTRIIADFTDFDINALTYKSGCPKLPFTFDSNEIKYD
jgi:hypothetical protein